MNVLTKILVLQAGLIFGFADVFYAPVIDWRILPVIAGIVALAFAASTAITYADIPEEILASVRRWHGSIDDQFGNIDSLVTTIQSHSWGTPPQVFSQIVTNRTQLSALILKCRSNNASPVDRGQRNVLLKTTVGLCLGQMKVWAYSQYYASVMTINDLHSLGFLLPGETGGHHSRAEATRVVAEVKVTILSADVINVVIDQSATDNAALVKHGWPPGVHTAVIVITSDDGKTEVLRLNTTRLYNEIKMPEGSHGKQFIIRAAFLRHLNDEPIFGPQPTFSMPLTTLDLAAIHDRQHHEEFEEHVREVERQRQELEQILARLNAANPSSTKSV
jgi:hypothetical protein